MVCRGTVYVFCSVVAAQLDLGGKMIDEIKKAPFPFPGKVIGRLRFHTVTIPQYRVNKTKQHTRLPWLAHDEAPGPYITIPQYQFNKTKQHTHGWNV